jgi:hypothetical protein
MVEQASLELLGAPHLPADIQRDTVYTLCSEYVLLPQRNLVPIIRFINSSGADARDPAPQSPHRRWYRSFQQRKSSQLGSCAASTQYCALAGESEEPEVERRDVY